jgi:putative oxidoreductase
MNCFRFLPPYNGLLSYLLFSHEEEVGKSNQTRGEIMNFGLFLLRLTLGIIFILHGGQKVIGWLNGPGLSGWVGFMSKMGVPSYLAYLAAFAEFLGGVGVLVGLLTRVAAFGIASVMVTAIATVHWKNGFFLNMMCDPSKGHGFEYAFALLGMALCLIFSGAGKISLDGMIFCKKKAPPPASV